MGRFLTKDTWDGDFNRPSSLNKWSYVEGNPINYTDPSGHCIFTGVDTVACLIALAVGIPVIAGVSTAAWDYSVTQGGGYGGVNWNNPDCIDLYQVLEAGKGGSLGALSSEGILLASIPLTPTYVMAYLVYGDSPAKVNMNLLSAFGLDDEYRTALNNSNFYAGQNGGNAAMTYISLATFLKGIPNIRITPNPVSIPTLQSGGLYANRLVLTLPGIEVVGGSGQLTYIGTAGMLPQVSMMSGGTTGPANKAQGQAGEAQVRKWLEESGFEILGEQVGIRIKTLLGNRIRIVDFLVVDGRGKVIAVEVKTGGGTLSPRQVKLDDMMRTQGGVITNPNVPPRYYNQEINSIETIYFEIP